MTVRGFRNVYGDSGADGAFALSGRQLFSNAELMFLNRFMPGLILGTFLQRMVLPEHTSPRNPMISPFLSVKANPSPLFRTGTSELLPPDERLRFRPISISLFSMA